MIPDARLSHHGQDLGSSYHPFLGVQNMQPRPTFKIRRRLKQGEAHYHGTPSRGSEVP